MGISMNPKISIITITYNSEKTLEYTIKSVISQEYDNLEYLIIDGGSTDKTLQIIDEYRDNISYVVSEPDKGISDAFNKGIKAATGEIIGIINSDDVLLPGALQTIANNYEEGIDVYRGNTIIWDDINDAKLSTKPTMRFPIGRMIKSVCHQSTFVTKSTYDRYGLFNVNYKYMMDADLLHRMYLGGAKFKYIDCDLAMFRLGGVTDSDYKKKLPEYRDMMISNGLSPIIAELEIVRFSIYNYIKKFLFAILGPNKARKLRYK